MSEYMLMKDGLGKDAINRIAMGLSASWPEFDSQGFKKSAITGIDKLELKQRVQHLIAALHQFLPNDFCKAAEILSRVPESWNFGDPNNSIRSFAAWPIIDYAAEYGLEEPEVSLDLLGKLTHLHTAEFAIRYFILRYPDLCFAKFDQWILLESEHIRRLVSEGTRPRLPWGIRLQPFCEDPSSVLPLLERLNKDPSDYVRRSVANNINDISKDNPDIAVTLCSNWMPEATKQTQWIIRHAMRSLIKSGRPDVFPLLGFTENPKLSIGHLELVKNQIKLGELLDFEVTITSKSNNKQRLAIDFAIHHQKANGQLSPKVFKWKETDLKPGETIQISKKHPMRKINTRKYYSGVHKVELIINGQEIKSLNFHLSCQD